MIRINFYFLLSILICFSACKKRDEIPVESKSEIISQGTFIGAEILVVIGENLAFDNRLCKITSNNTIDTINFSTGSGSSIKLNALSLSNGTPEYIPLVFSIRGNAPEDAYLLNRNNFSLIPIRQYGIPQVNGIGNKMNPVTYYDGKSSLYYGAWASYTSYNIVKLDLNHAPNITGSYVLPDTTYMYNYDVDKYGNVITYFQGNNSGLRYNRIVKMDGKLYDYNSPCLTSLFWMEIDSTVAQYDFCNQNFTKAIYNLSVQDFSINSFMTNVYRLFDSRVSYRVIYNNKMIWIDSEIFEWTVSATSPAQITSIPFTSIKLVDHTQSNGVLYFSGNDASGQETIFKVNLSNYSYTTISDPGKYSFNCIETMNDGTIYASATRVSDGKNVFVKFSSSGVETLLDETINRKALYMTKVNEY